MKRTKWIAALVLILTLVMTATASAETIKLAYSDGSLYLRSGPGTSYEAVGVLHDGDSISVVSTGSVWSKIKTSSGKTGYVKNLYISGSNTNYASGTTYFSSSYTVKTTASVNLRSGASTSTAVITTLSKGTKLTALGKNGSFYLVKTSGGTQGYVHKNYVTTTSSSGSSSSSSSSTTATLYVAGGSTIYVRSGASTSTSKVTTVSTGDKVTILSKGSIWSKIKTSSGKVGYVKNLYLKDGSSTGASGTTYFSSSYTVTTTANVNMRSGASTSTAVITTLSKGTKVTALGKNGSFYLVKTSGGTQGYVHKSYLK